MPTRGRAAAGTAATRAPAFNPEDISYTGGDYVREWLERVVQQRFPHATLTRELVLLPDVVVPAEYQRNVHHGKVIYIEKQFNPVSAGVLVCSRRPDGERMKDFIIDGQHRLLAMRRLEFVQWPADVYGGLSVEEEAQVFTDYNARRGRPDAMTIFRADLLAGNPTVVSILAILERHGYALAHSSTGKKHVDEFRAVTMLRRIYALAGPEYVEQVVSLMRMIWPEEQEATSRNIAMALWGFLARYPEASVDTLIDALRATTIPRLYIEAFVYQGRAQGRFRTTMQTQLVRVLVDSYNNALKAARAQRDLRLPDIDDRPMPREFRHDTLAAAEIANANDPRVVRFMDYQALIP